MASQPSPPPDGFEEIRTLVKQGDVFAVQDWITQGKPLFEDISRRKNLLTVAIENDFYSMVEVLAKPWSHQHSLDNALQMAADKRRADLVWLLLKHGADRTAVSLGSIAGCCDKDLMRYFLDNWNVVAYEDALFDVVTAMPRPLTGLIKEYAQKIPDYEKQMTQALYWFVTGNHPRWIALAIWMGANPRLRVPKPFSEGDFCFYSDKDEPEEWMSPIERAVFEGNLQSVKLMKPKRDTDDLEALLNQVWRPECLEVGEYLLSLGADVNNKLNGGSSVLEYLLKPAFSWDPSNLERNFGYSEIALVEKWVALGARFIPDDDYVVREARNCIYLLRPNQVEPFIKTLLKTTPSEIVFKLFNTPKIRRQIGLNAKDLDEKIQALLRKR